MALPIMFYVASAVLVFVIGVYCLSTKRNFIKMVIGVELLINAAHLNLVVFSMNFAEGMVDPYGQTIVVVSLGIGAAVIAIALLLGVQVYRMYGTLDIQQLKRLRR